jgi:hypothetical protein
MTTNLFVKTFIGCADLDTKLPLHVSSKVRNLNTVASLSCAMSAHIAIVSARSPTHEVRSIRDRDGRSDIFLVSIGEAVHHQIDCLRCCGSHEREDHDRLNLL